ncbi:MAG: hypothetical protein HQL38_02410 [Alphaproteobacteria bacterium]|nr:hypothetical protein [Alphaproteobacteria bacterium]
MASADGRRADLVRVAALLEGLRVKPGLVEDGGAAAKALDAYEWLCDGERAVLASRHRLLVARAAPIDSAFAAEIEDLADRGEAEGQRERERLIDAALVHLEAEPGPSLLAFGRATWRWLAEGGDRMAVRTALPAFLIRRGIVGTYLPCLIGAAAWRRDAPDQEEDWIAGLVATVASEAAAGLALLSAQDGAWLDARRMVAARRTHADSRLPGCVDLLTAMRLIGPTRLARTLGISVRGASLLLAELVRLGAAVELTGQHRNKIFGLTKLVAEIAAVVTPVLPRSAPQHYAVRAPALPAPMPFKAPMRAATDPQLDLDAMMARLDGLLADTNRAVENAQKVLSALAGEPTARAVATAPRE